MMGRGAKRSLDVANAEVPSRCGLFTHVQHCWQAHAQAPAVMPYDAMGSGLAAAS